MTGPIIPVGRWPEWADRHCWDERGVGQFIGFQTDKYSWRKWAANSSIPRPSGWDWRVPVMRHQPPAIDLEQFRRFIHACGYGAGASPERKSEADRLLALIDGQANVRSSSEHSDSLTPVAHKKLQGLQDEGFIINGVAIYNPTTNRRGLVDYLGYVGWQTREQPSVAPVPPSTVTWHPIETAPKDNKRPLYLAQFDTETGKLIDLDWDASWEQESASWEIPQVYYIWRSANGRVEEPTHWAYQDLQQPNKGEEADSD